jgi:NitT/TauT family transport system substrate-binding protein
MGGPQMNVTQLMAAGQADCIMSSDTQAMQTRAGGVPVTVVAAYFQKDPDVLIVHEDVKSLEDLKTKTILISASANRSYWPWLKAKYGFTDSQTRAYTFNSQPFLADQNTAQQGFLTSDPLMVEKLGVKFNILLLSDYGYPAYSNTVSCLEKTVSTRGKQIAAFLEATAEGWKSYLANPEPGNVLIKRDNPKMADDQLAYSLAKMKEARLVTGGDAQTLGIGVITDAREKATYDFLVDAKLVDPAKLDLKSAYTTEFVKNIHVLP